MKADDSTECSPALELLKVSKRFSRQIVLDGISLAIPHGQAVALLGQNGVGKTTLMRICCGVCAPDAGEVRICGKPASIPQSRLPLGYLPENAPPLPGYRVDEELRLFAKLHGLDGKAADTAIESAIELCELASVRHRIAEQLSKGYRHRLGLAQAMLHSPKLLLLDEPTDGLDPRQKEATQQLLRNLAGKCAVLLSTHLLDEVPQICDRMVILARQTIVYDGPVTEDVRKTFREATEE